MTTQYDKIKQTLADLDRERLQRQWIKILKLKRGYVHIEKG